MKTHRTIILARTLRPVLTALLLSSASAHAEITAGADSYSTDMDVPLIVAAPGVLANDSTDAPPLVVIDSRADDGTVVVDPAGGFVYTPPPGFFGSTRFRYTIEDFDGDKQEIDVDVTVNAGNTPPTADDQSVSVDEDSSVAITLTGADPDGDPFTFHVADSPSNGTLDGTAPNLTYTPAPGFSGSDSFTFVTEDADFGQSAPAKVSITVNPVNDAPSADDQSVTTDEDTPVSISLGGSDPDGDPIVSYAIVSGPGKGTLSGTAPNLTYTPNANANGSDSFTYTVSDGSATSAPATVEITILPANDAPVANAQSVSVNEDVNLNILLTGSDADGDALNYSISTPPSKGTLTGTPPNVVYRGASNYNGPDSFEFTVADGQGGSASAVVSINVVAINDRPVANGQTVTTAEDTAVAITLTGSDIEGSTLTYSLVSAPAYGTLSGSGASRTYTPNPNFNGADSFRFRVSDGSLNSLTATVTINVTAVNDAPVTSPVAVTTDEDTPVAITLPGSDVDGNPLTFTVVSAPASGSLSGTGASLTYTPNANYHGADSFTFTVSDGTLTTAVTTASITVNPVNDPPTTAPVAVTTDEDTAVTVTLPGSDVEGGPLSFAIVGAPAGGTLSGDGPVRTYTPNPNFNGADSFTFTVSDGSATTAVTTASITVNPVNDAPTAAGASLQTNEDQALAGSLPEANDVDGDTVTYALATPAASGVADVQASGAFTYTPNANFNGTDSFSYGIDDGNGGAATYTVTVEVVAVNDAPTAGDLAEQTDEDTPLSGQLPAASDLDNDPVGYALAAQAGKGTATVDPSGAYTYTPNANFNGTDTFGYQVDDGNGGTATYQVSVEVAAVNDAPVVVNPVNEVRVPEDAPSVTVELANVFGDVDIATDGDSLTLDLVSIDKDNPALFTTESFAGTTLTLEPAPDQFGTATITVDATDTQGASVSHTFTVVVESVNDVPAAEDDTASMVENGEALAIAVLDNDYPGEAPTQIVSVGTNGYTDSDPVTILDYLGNPITWPDGSNSNGRVTIEGDHVVYEPKPYFHGTDTFTYTIRDSDGDESTGTVTVTVTSVNSPPQGPQERTFFMQEAGMLTVAAGDGLLTGIYDPDNARLGVDGDPIVTQTLALQTSVPAVGELDIDIETGAFTYTPPTDFVGEVSFTYQLTDGESFSAPASVARIVVLEAPPAAEPPVPGQVAIPFNLANAPLEQTVGVPPNVLVVMDDSNSMDYQVVVPDGPDESLMVLDNTAAGQKKPYAQTYGYLYDLSSNSMQSTNSAGAVLPTDEALTGGDFTNQKYGLWRARNHQFNTLYYNPAMYYTPWVGSDVNNVAFANADPTKVRLDPIDPSSSRVINILNNHSYKSVNVPVWNGSKSKVTVNVTVYIPHYYTTTATGVPAWNSTKTKVEIKNDGSTYTGGPNRADCAVGDGNPMTCTYAQEIQNFANWFQYYRTREYVTKASMGKVVSQVQDVRLGYLTISAPTTLDIRDMNDLYTEGNKKALLDNIYSVDSKSEGSPQRQQLKRAGETFACSRGGMECPRLPEPAGLCQQNFALLFTDGYWSQGTGVSSNEDANTASPFDGGRYADSFSSTLADTAMYYYKTDLWPDGEDLVPVGRRDETGAPEGTFDGDQARMHQHMKTYSIAFGVKGTIEESDLPEDPTEAFAWPDPMNAPAYKIDDVLHAAVNGRGQYLNASNPQELQSALEDAFLEFTQAASSTSSAAFNSTSLEEGTLLYRGFYDLRYNIGELTATLVDAQGDLADTPLWKASEELDDLAADDRVIVTYDPAEREGIPFRFDQLTASQQLTLSADEVDFLRGDRSVESPDGDLRTRELVGGLLGDIVNSSPVFVGPPRSINRDQAPYPIDDLYSEFAADYYDRDPIVYVGANDGMLHGFDAQSGVERFAYVPNKLIDASLGYRNVLDQFASPFYQHKYFVDLTPRLNDVFITPNGSASKQWRTLLVGGLGAGGKGFYALDVTDPSIYASESTAADAVLWEFSDEDDTYPVDADGDPLGGTVGAITDPLGAPVKDLGYSLSLPTVAMSNVEDGGSPVRKEWVAIFGNGQNSTSGIAKLFVLFVDKGKDGWADGDFVKIDTGFGVPLSPHPLTGFPNGLGTPTAVDSDLNGTVDLVYAGDRLGNLFRFDISDADPAEWKSTRIFTASYTEGGANTIQPILSQPLVLKHPSAQGFLVIFGTGSYFTRDDARSEDIQSIYAIWDRGENNPATAAADTRERRLVEQELTNVVDDTGDPAVTRRVFLGTQPVEYLAQNCSTADCSADGDEPGTYGWYVDLDLPRATQSVSGDPVVDTSGREPPEAQFPGERAIRRIVERNGNLVTTTVLPALDEFSCFGTRPGAILVLSALTGGDAEDPLIDFNNDGKIDAQDLLNLGDEYYSGGLLFDQTDLDGQLVDLSTLGGVGDTDFLFVSGGNDTVAYLFEGIEDGRTGRLSWRELESAD